jgi:hypothetical protein
LIILKKELSFASMKNDNIKRASSHRLPPAFVNNPVVIIK